MDNTVGDITFFLQLFGISFAVLVALLVVIKIALAVLRRLARRQLARTDLDLIGRRALVTHSIRRNRPGKIRCETEPGRQLVVEAVSDSLIRSGQTVLITAIDHGCCRVLPASPEQEPGRERSDP